MPTSPRADGVLSGGDRVLLNDRYEIDTLSFVNLVIRRRRLVAFASASLALIVLIVALLSPRTYTATASFTPQTKRSAVSAAAGLAAQLGISVATGEASQSPAFYAELLKSREILTAVAHDSVTYRDGETQVRGRLLDVLPISEKDSARRLSKTLRWLTQRSKQEVSTRTGLITLRVTAPTPELAYQLASHFLDELSEFNVQSRQNQAGSERRFTETRLHEARDSLRAAEERLQGFLQRNRDWRNSPELSAENDRLTREILFRQQVYTSLAQAYEQARIDEVRDTPVFTVTERPAPPLDPDSRGLLVKLLLAALGGAIIGVIFAMIQQALTGPTRTLATTGEEFEFLRRELVADLRRPWRLFLPTRPDSLSAARAESTISDRPTS